MGTIRDLMIRLGVDVDVEDGMNKAAELFKSGGARMVAGAATLGLQVGAELSKAFAANIEVEAANDKLAAQLGLTEKESARSGKVAGELYADAYGDSMGNVNEAIKNVNFNISNLANLSDGDLKSITAGVMDIAKAFDQDLGGTTRAVGKLMKTGLAPDAQSAMDMVTIAFQQGSDQGGDLLDTVNEYSVQFKKLGLDGPTALGLISQGLKGGARDADIVADAFKEFSIRAIDGSQLTADSFNALGLDGKQMGHDIAAGGSSAFDATRNVVDALNTVEDPVKRAQIAVGLFGTQSEDLGDAFKQLDLTTAASEGGFDSLAGATDRLGATLADNAQTKITTMQRGFEQWTQSMVEIPGTMGDISAGIMAFGPQALGMAGSIGMIVSGFGGMAVAGAKAVGGVIVSFASMVTSATAAAGTVIASIATQVAQWVFLGVQSLLQAARVAAAWLIALGPIGLIVAAVIAIVALIVLNWDKIKNAIGAAWEWVKTATKAAWDWIVNAVKVAIDFVTKYFLPFALVRLIAENWDKIKAAAKAAWDWVVNAIKTAIDRSINAINTLKEIPGKVLVWFAEITRGAVAKLGELVNWLKGLPGRITQAVGNLGQLLYNAGRDILNGLWNGIQSMAGWIRDRVYNFFSGILPQWAKDALGIASPSKLFASFGKMTMAGFGLGMEKQTGKVLAIATNVIDSVSDVMSQPLAGSMSFSGVGGGLVSSTYIPPGAPTYGPSANNTYGSGGGNVYIQNVNLQFADDRDLYAKGQEAAAGLREYKSKGGVLPS